MRSNRKKRLGVCGALTLLCLTVVAGAFASSAGAQVVTGQFVVKVVVDNGTGGTADKTSFAFTLDGGAPQNYPATGIVSFDVDPTVTHTFAPVDFPDFTGTPNENCTDITLTPGTPIVCTIVEKFNEPATTTTTTTTLPPVSTTQPPVGQTTVHGSAADTNKCTSHLEPELQPDGKPAIVVELSSDAGPQPHLGDPITLSDTKVGLTIPATLLQSGVDVNLIKNGDKVPSVVTTVIAGSNTVEQTHSYSVSQTATIVVKGGKAQPLHATLALPTTNWTPVNGTSDVLFSEKSVKIVSTISLKSAGLTVTATFKCSPSTAPTFVALGATGVPSTTGGATTPTTIGDGPVNTSATGGATELPRTGSSPWPLLVVAAVCIDLGMLAIAAAKRRRRPLHQS